MEETDFVLPRPAVDIVVRGHAVAPDASPVQSLLVTVRIGDQSKSALVFGDRIWERRIGSLTPSRPLPFGSVPLVYERAYGGVDKQSDPGGNVRLETNPVGRGFATHANHLTGQPLPNIESPTKRISVWNDRPPPVGFGPIAREWAPRIGFAGTFDDVWHAERRPLWPRDLDARFFQCAPSDQQFPALRGGEPVSLLGFTESGTLTFSLPRVALGMRTRLGNENIEQRPGLTLVVIDVDASRVTLVFLAHLRCHGREHELSRTTVWEKEILTVGRA